MRFIRRALYWQQRDSLCEIYDIEPQKSFLSVLRHGNLEALPRILHPTPLNMMEGGKFFLSSPITLLLVLKYGTRSFLLFLNNLNYALTSTVLEQTLIKNPLEILFIKLSSIQWRMEDERTKPFTWTSFVLKVLSFFYCYNGHLLYNSRF